MGSIQPAHMDQPFCLHFFSHEMFFFALLSASHTEPSSELGCFKKKEQTQTLLSFDLLTNEQAFSTAPASPVPGTGLAPSLRSHLPQRPLLFSRLQLSACRAKPWGGHQLEVPQEATWEGQEGSSFVVLSLLALWAVPILAHPPESPTSHAGSVRALLGNALFFLGVLRPLSAALWCRS